MVEEGLLAHLNDRRVVGCRGANEFFWSAARLAVTHRRESCLKGEIVETAETRYAFPFFTTGRILATMADAGSRFLDAAAMPWRPFDEAPGVAFKVLKAHRPGTGVTLLLRFAAGAAYPTHRHPEGEEYYVLEGELVDAGRAYGTGTYVFHPPGSVHRPSSPSGATVLVLLPSAIELV